MDTQLAPLVIESRCETHVVGMARAFTMQTRHEIPALWQTFWAADADVLHAVAGAAYGISFAMHPDGEFRYGVGYEVDPVPDVLPEGFCTMTLSAGDHAGLRAFGPVSALPKTFDSLFSTLLPDAGVVPREGAVFERYPDDPRNGPDGMAYEIWVPVQKAG